MIFPLYNEQKCAPENSRSKKTVSRGKPVDAVELCSRFLREGVSTHFLYNYQIRFAHGEQYFLVWRGLKWLRILKKRGVAGKNLSRGNPTDGVEIYTVQATAEPVFVFLLSERPLFCGPARPTTNNYQQLSKTQKPALRLLARCISYLIVVQGNRTDTLVKELSAKTDCISWFALGQAFPTHPAFFGNAKRLQTAPDQEILLPVRETYLIVVQEVCADALLKESAAKLNSIDWFASGQGFLGLLVFGGAFWLVFVVYLLLIQLFDSAPPSHIKLSPKSWGWERFAHRKLQKKTCGAVQTESFSSWHTYGGRGWIAGEWCSSHASGNGPLWVVKPRTSSPRSR